jgi:predicted DNA-binding protein (MmcQ/YjbR family)
MPRTADPALAKLRQICLELPEAHEVPAWGTFTWRTKKIFAMYAMPSDSTHSGGRPGVWLAAAPGNQSLMVRERPERFFVPPYVGSSGWIGVWLDRRPSWKEVAALVEDSWRLTAPKKTVSRR